MTVEQYLALPKEEQKQYHTEPPLACYGCGNVLVRLVGHSIGNLHSVCPTCGICPACEEGDV